MSKFKHNQKGEWALVQLRAQTKTRFDLHAVAQILSRRTGILASDISDVKALLCLKADHLRDFLRVVEPERARSQGSWVDFGHTTPFRRDT